MKVSVSQYGSRRRYMIPQILEKEGILDCLYTDSTSDSFLGRLATFINHYIKDSASLNKLSNRRTGIPSEKVYTNDWLQAQLICNRLLHKPVLSEVETIFEGSAKRFIRYGVGNIDWLYTMFIENFEFILYAKNKGVKILADIYENPYIWDELCKEIENDAYKSIFSLKPLYEAQSALRKKYIDRLLETADQYLVPSEYVRDSLRQSVKFDDNKVNIIPYVSSIKNKQYTNNPIPGRIIWIGNDVVRKGLCYCADAARELKKKFTNIDFRIIGPVPEILQTDEHFKDLTFVGYCNKQQLETEFNAADMFVFPTLAEGFAGVLLEASSFGVPIITTDASGFSKDAPCVFISKHDSKVIVEEVSRIIQNREYRSRLSHNIFDYSQSISTNQFSDQLLTLLHTK